MYASRQGTMEFHKSRPLMALWDISQNTIADAYTALKKIDKTAKPSIGEMAVVFYQLNHGVGLVKSAFAEGEALPERENAFMEEYQNAAGAIGLRMFCDMIFMLTAMCSTTHPDEWHFERVRELYGAETREWIESIAGSQGKVSFWTPNMGLNDKVFTAASSLGEKVKLGEGARALGYILDMRQKELAYGPLWRDVARMLARTIEGGVSMETMIDLSFAYCHCNGSFFEKGRLFTAVGNELFNALDVQRSGQVPQYVHEGKASLTRGALAKKHNQMGAALFPEVFAKNVNWGIVQKVTQNTLTFHNKYQKAWNAAMGGGGAAQRAHDEEAKKKPKIFMPVGEDDYLDNLSKTGFARPGKY